jgi:hypothetical protein
MPDLEALFEDLAVAADTGRFEAALMASPLADQFVSRHPLGFHVVRLEEPPYALRLHLWKPGGVDQPGFEIHDHTFSLRSRVIDGAIRHRTYTVQPDAEGHQVVYAVEYATGESRIAKTAVRVRTVLKSDEVFGAGSLYAVPAGELHDAELSDSATGTTLVLTTHIGEPVRTIGPWDGPEILTASRTARSPQPLRDLGLHQARAL